MLDKLEYYINKKTFKDLLVLSFPDARTMTGGVIIK
jgi:hypothetical protein